MIRTRVCDSKRAPVFHQVNESQEGHKGIEDMFLPKRELSQANKKRRWSKKKKKKKKKEGGGLRILRGKLKW